MIQARDYQVEAVQSIFRYFEKHGAEAGNPVIAMPTGTGKSIVIADFLKKVISKWPNQRIMCVTHVKELIKQNYEKLIMLWPFAPAGIYSAGLNRRDIHDSIIFGGIASVAKRAAEFGRIDLLMIDEAHLLSPNDDTLYQKFIRELKARNPFLKVIGLTATPYRLGHGHIADGELFHHVCFDITGIESFTRLIAEGYLSPLVPKNTKTLLDTEGVHVRGGEFIASELQIAVDKDEVTYAALREALELGHDRRHILVFASGVEHSCNIRNMLESMGEIAEVVHSKLASGERDRALESFQNGKARWLVGNNIFTTGFDSPWVDCIVCLRPTASSVLWVQMLGRGTRPYDGLQMPWGAYDPIPKMNCLALDFANNTRRLGPINDPVVPRKKGEGGGTAPVKECLVCNTWNHISARECFICGSKFDIAVKIQQEAGTLDLIVGELPQIEVFEVETITYRTYSKIGKPNSIKATYYCGLSSFSEWLCFEHQGYPAKLARDWWRFRTDLGVPVDCDDALSILPTIAAPTHLRVWINQKHPKIMAQCFDGTAFNTQAPKDKMPTITADIKRKHTVVVAEEDIPF